MTRRPRARPGRARRRTLAWLAAALAATAAPARARREPAWPPRALRIVVAYPAGGVSSDVARELARALERHLGVPVIVDHHPGAGGTLAMAAVARSEVDPVTLCFSAVTPLTLAPWLGPVPYDPARDLAPVFAVMATPVLVLGTAALQADSLAGMLAEARRQPGRIRWATSGLGTTGHLVLERVAAAAGVVLTHVPYKGGAQPLTDALGAHFEVLSSNVAAHQLQLVREGRLKALAVTGRARAAALPGVPTLAELGYAAANQVSVFGLFAAASLPAARRERLEAAVAVAWRDPALQRRLDETNNLPLGFGGAAFERLVADEREANRAWLDRDARR